MLIIYAIGIDRHWPSSQVFLILSSSSGTNKHTNVHFRCMGSESVTVINVDAAGEMQCVGKNVVHCVVALTKIIECLIAVH